MMGVVKNGWGRPIASEDLTGATLITGHTAIWKLIANVSLLEPEGVSVQFISQFLQYPQPSSPSLVRNAVTLLTFHSFFFIFLSLYNCVPPPHSFHFWALSSLLFLISYPLPFYSAPVLIIKLALFLLWWSLPCFYLSSLVLNILLPMFGPKI